ncbi:pyridoxamine 5'-phosphate oxidase family protein [Erythrobacter sp.]|uniref:pyridoxamine 5'-phosphate oxidase family protein n=1 Tax=Erythrobacter sp. TaxID=1042 RepID=UPI003C737495
MTQSSRSLAEITKRMRAIDICMLVTKTGKDAKIAARPMSNNQDVDRDDGTTYHFASDDGRIDDDLRRSNECGATYSDGDFWAAIQGTARLIHDRSTMEEHWVPDLEKWFEDGLDSPDLVLIEVVPSRIAWWEGRENGELTPGS